MYLSLNSWRRTLIQVLFVCLAIFTCFSAAMSQAQSNAADLQGVVRDQNGAVVPNASVTARNAGTRICLARYGFGFRGFPQAELREDEQVIDRPAELLSLA